MASATVHLAVYTMADWEFGYVVAHINSPEFQKEPGRSSVKTFGRTLGLITTKGGIQIQPNISLDMLSPQDSKMLILSG